MPRYVNHDTGQFWEIALAGTGFQTTFGPIGGEAETSKKTFGDAARARSEHDRVVARKLARGFVADDGKPGKRAKRAAKPAEASGPARNDKLEAAIAKNLDDVDAYLVYADWLTDRGDPRGEVIALQAKGKTKTAAKLIDEHREQLLGDLHELSSETLRVTWKHGFIESVRLAKVAGGADADERTTGAQLAALLALPAGAFVREIVIGTADGIDDGDVHFDSVVEALGRLKPPHVQSIYLGDLEEFQVSWMHAGDVSPLWSLPALEKLTIQAGTMELGTIDSKTLREAHFISGGLTSENLQSIAKAKWPKLERLAVWFGSEHYGANGGVEDLRELLAGKSVPALRHLALCNGEFADDLAAALAGAKIVKQLDTLDLSKGTMTDAGASALVAAKSVFEHLDELDVSDNCIASTASLKAIAKKVITGRQKPPDERYVSLGE